MKILVAKGVLEGLKSFDMGPCENCVMSKHKRVSFTKATRELKKVVGNVTYRRLGIISNSITWRIKVLYHLHR